MKLEPGEQFIPVRGLQLEKAPVSLLLQGKLPHSLLLPLLCLHQRLHLCLLLHLRLRPLLVSAASFAATAANTPALPLQLPH